MVDTTQLNYLPEADEYPEGIVRIENGWAPNGGAVDPENNGGIANWQAQDLARRTHWLKARISAAASSAVAGLMKLASQEQAEAGTDNTTAMTPLRVRQTLSAAMSDVALSAGFVRVGNGNGGYLRLPTWLGGLLFQWGAVVFAASGDTTHAFTFPVAFPQAIMASWWFRHGIMTSKVIVPFIVSADLAGMTLGADKDDVVAFTVDARWFAIGY